MRWILPALLLGFLLTASTGEAKDPVEKGKKELFPEKIVGHSFEPKRVAATKQRIAGLKLPAGFRLSVFANGLHKPRMMVVDRDGAVLVTSFDGDFVLRLVDRDGDGRADSQKKAVAGLKDVHGIALHQDQLFLATGTNMLIPPWFWV